VRTPGQRDPAAEPAVRPRRSVSTVTASLPNRTEPDRSELARRIYRVSHLTGEFTLRSGVVSHEYFDKYRFEADPALLLSIAEAMQALVPGEVEALAGLELGGVPLATVLSQVTGLDALFVRKEAKTYGTCRLAEGGELDGRRLLVVEDVVTSGGAVLDAARELRERGAVLDRVACVIDRESGGRENLAEAGLTLDALFTMTELTAAAD
jgi:orotate phosphoribosyltransferase